mmetsp:Transcript_27958/g.71129  ORF Transcript_27958/g.71129 Transcript_27958/m.71129 type:complete len:280 (-) Transcript_27958:349-1188(-)
MRVGLDRGFGPVGEETLDERQVAALEEMRSRFLEGEGEGEGKGKGSDLTKSERHFLSDSCFLRYLRARNWKVEKAAKKLEKTLAWRREYGVYDLHPTDLAEVQEHGKLYRHGGDKYGRPALVMRPWREKDREHPKNLKLLVHHLEKLTDDMRGGVEKLIIIIDMNHFAFSTFPSLQTSHKTLKILQSHYPERLGQGFLIQPPLLFYGLWKMISPLMDPVTKRKTQFLRGKDIPKTILEHFDANHVEKDFAGESAFEYNHDEYWEKEEPCTAVKIAKADT